MGLDEKRVSLDQKYFCWSLYFSNVVLSLIVLVFTQNTFAELAPYAIKTSRVGSGVLLQFAPPDKHHFNDEAPSKVSFQKKQGSLEKAESLIVRKDEIKAIVPDREWVKVHAELYLCDNKNTYCVPQTQDFEVFNEKVSKLVVKNGMAANDQSVAVSDGKSSEVNEYGFFVNDAEKAFEIAKAEKRPLIIDFYGIWCPPCNQLDETVFNQQEFQKKAQRFVKLKLDADQEKSFSYKHKYKVSGYPTILFVAWDGDEILRVVGSRSLSDFNLKVDEALKNENQSIQKLVERAEKNDFGAMKALIPLLTDKQDYSGALKWISKLEVNKKLWSKVLEKQKVVALVGEARAAYQKTSDEKTASLDTIKVLADTYRQRLLDALGKFQNEVEAFMWSQDLGSLGEEQGLKEIETKGHQLTVQLGNRLAAQAQKLKGLEITNADVFMAIAEAYRGLEKPEDAKKYYLKAIEVYDGFLKSYKLDPSKERGYNLEKAYCLSRAGKFEESQSIYQALEKEFPKEFTFYFAHGSMLKRENKFLEAEPVARKAFELSYGDNHLRSADLLAQVLIKNNKKDEAKKIVSETLASAKIPNGLDVRTFRYIRQLEKRLSEINLEDKK